MLMQAQQVMHMIAPLHLRVLLDLARVKIMRIILPNAQWWDDLRQNRSHHDLTAEIEKSTSLNQAAAKFICNYNRIRNDGNKAAHSATLMQIQAAIDQRPLSERPLLQALYDFISEGVAA